MLTWQARHGQKDHRWTSVAWRFQLLGVLLCGGQLASEQVTYEVVHGFGPPFPAGAFPSSLVQGCDGSLFGITETETVVVGVGGTIFKLDLVERKLATLHSFAREDCVGRPLGLILGIDGNLYGTTGLWYSAKLTHAGTLFKVDCEGLVSTLHTFALPEGFQGCCGISPRVHFQASDGSLYGTTGGEPDSGTVFKLDPAGNMTTLHSFEGPDRWLGFTLVEGSDGRLYGTSAGGGASGKGTIFKRDPDAEGTFTTLHSFSGPDGSSPNTLIAGRDGRLFGTTAYGGASGRGTIFKLDPEVDGTLTTLYSFSGVDGNRPNTLVEGIDRCLYGTTSNGGLGTIFKLDTAGHFETLRVFSRSDEAGPPQSFIQGNDGSLYGTTALGHSSLGGVIVDNPGTVFKIDREGQFTTLHSFLAQQGTSPRTLIQGTDGSLYGTTGDPHGLSSGVPTPATIFKVDVEGTFTTLGSPGGQGLNALIQATDGSLYGTSIHGDANFWGAIFKVDSAGNFTTLYSFAGPDFGGSDGYLPNALFQGSDGCLYGTTAVTIFKLNLDGRLTTLHTFTEPVYSFGHLNILTEGNDGNLYGVTEVGGASGEGTLFRFDLAEPKLTTLHSFDVRGPKTIFRGSDGSLYGTTSYYDGGGTIFNLDLEGNLTILYTFTGDGEGTRANILVQGRDGTLYGTRMNWPMNESAHSVFKLDPEDPEGTFTTLYSFVENDASSLGLPTALIQARDGHLYGTTESGGRANGGFIFRLRLPSPALQRPGDCNQDGELDISDAICLLGFLFLGSPAALPCGDGTSGDPANRELLDWNVDAAVDLSDAVGALTWLFSGGPPHAIGSECRGIGGCAETCTTQ